MVDKLAKKTGESRRLVREYGKLCGVPIGPSKGAVSEAIVRLLGLDRELNEPLQCYHMRAGRYIKKTKLVAKRVPKAIPKKKPKVTPKRKSKGFYDSREWRKIRYQAIVKHDGCCLACGRSHKKHGIVIHVDHIKPRSIHPKLELDIDNLQILCEDCNLGKSNKDDTDWR